MDAKHDSLHYRAYQIPWFIGEITFMAKVVGIGRTARGRYLDLCADHLGDFRVRPAHGDVWERVQPGEPVEIRAKLSVRVYSIKDAGGSRSEITTANHEIELDVIDVQLPGGA